MRAIDFHVHLPTADWMDGSMAGYIEPAEAYFRSSAHRGSLDELAERYQALHAWALLLAWDAETATVGLPEAALDRLLYANAARILGITDTDS